MGHLQTGDHRLREKSGHRKKVTCEENSHTVNHTGSYKSGCRKKAERGAHCCTDQLETTEGWISNDMKIR